MPTKTPKPRRKPQAAKVQSQDFPEMASNTKVTLVVVAVDVSQSTNQAAAGDEVPRFKRFEGAMNEIIAHIREDEVASRSVRLMIITFGGTVDVTPFQHIGEVEKVVLAPYGNTPLAQAIERGLDEIDQELVEINLTGGRVNTPTLLTLTDGASTENESFVKKVAARVKEATDSGNLFSHNFGCYQSDVDTLDRFGFRASLMPDSYEEFITLVSCSLTAVSRGQRVDLFED